MKNFFTLRCTTYLLLISLLSDSAYSIQGPAQNLNNTAKGSLLVSGLKDVTEPKPLSSAPLYWWEVKNGLLNYVTLLLASEPEDSYLYFVGPGTELVFDATRLLTRFTPRYHKVRWINSSQDHWIHQPELAKEHARNNKMSLKGFEHQPATQSLFKTSAQTNQRRIVIIEHGKYPSVIKPLTTYLNTLEPLSFKVIHQQLVLEPTVLRILLSGLNPISLSIATHYPAGRSLLNQIPHKPVSNKLERQQGQLVTLQSPVLEQTALGHILPLSLEELRADLEFYTSSQLQKLQTQLVKVAQQVTRAKEQKAQPGSGLKFLKSEELQWDKIIHDYLAAQQNPALNNSNFITTSVTLEQWMEYLPNLEELVLLSSDEIQQMINEEDWGVLVNQIDTSLITPELIKTLFKQISVGLRLDLQAALIEKAYAKDIDLIITELMKNPITNESKELFVKILKYFPIISAHWIFKNQNIDTTKTWYLAEAYPRMSHNEQKIALHTLWRFFSAAASSIELASWLKSYQGSTHLLFDLIEAYAHETTIWGHNEVTDSLFALMQKHPQDKGFKVIATQLLTQKHYLQLAPHSLAKFVSLGASIHARALLEKTFTHPNTHQYSDEFHTLLLKMPSRMMDSVFSTGLLTKAPQLITQSTLLTIAKRVETTAHIHALKQIIAIYTNQPQFMNQQDQLRAMIGVLNTNINDLDLRALRLDSEIAFIERHQQNGQAPSCDTYLRTRSL